MKQRVALLCAAVVLGLLPALTAAPAFAADGPALTALSKHRGAYWGGTLLTIRGEGFTHAREVQFGRSTGYSVDVLSDSRLTVRVPYHDYGTVHVQVVTDDGTTPRVPADRFTFVPPSMTSPIMGGLTARQEQRISADVRARHHGVRRVHASRWTPAVGVAAMRRARSWLGLPYSWAGGSGSGPTTGVCAHNGGDLDCHVVGFDCSGLTMYAWSPYRQLAHYAATQHGQAGRFHPAIGQLMPGDLVFFSAYIPNGIGHVAVYEGHGMVIQAEQSGTQVMRSRLSDVIAYSGSYRGATRPDTTGRKGIGPQVLPVTAQLPVGGGLVTIRGSHLAAATSVSVGRTMLYSFVSRSAHRLVIRVPAHRAGPVPVAVSNAWGTALTKLTYVAAPHVSAVTPAEGPVAGGNQVTITGRNLASVTAVTVDGTPLPLLVKAQDRLVVRMAPHPAGPAQLSLHSPFGDSNQVGYTFLAPPPSG